MKVMIRQPSFWLGLFLVVSCVIPLLPVTFAYPGYSSDGEFVVDHVFFVQSISDRFLQTPLLIYLWIIPCGIGIVSLLRPWLMRIPIHPATRWLATPLAEKLLIGIGSISFLITYFVAFLSWPNA